MSRRGNLGYSALQHSKAVHKSIKHEHMLPAVNAVHVNVQHTERQLCPATQFVSCLQ